MSYRFSPAEDSHDISYLCFFVGRRSYPSMVDIVLVVLPHFDPPWGKENQILVMSPMYVEGGSQVTKHGRRPRAAGDLQCSHICSV